MYHMLWLLVAKLALKIQAEESPLYDNVLICFGAFQIQMTYFAAIGYLLAESGGPQILADIGVVAAGSVNGFISGRHYTCRCKRLHIILSVAILSGGDTSNTFLKSMVTYLQNFCYN